MTYLSVAPISWRANRIAILMIATALVALIYLSGVLDPVLAALHRTVVLAPLAWLIALTPTAAIIYAAAQVLRRHLAVPLTTAAIVSGAAVLAAPILIAWLPSQTDKATASDIHTLPQLGRDHIVAVLDKTSTSYRDGSRCDVTCATILKNSRVGAIMIPRAWDQGRPISGVIYRLGSEGRNCDHRVQRPRGGDICLTVEPAPFRVATHVLHRAPLGATTRDSNRIGIHHGTRISLTQAGPQTTLFQQTWVTGRSYSGLPVLAPWPNLNLHSVASVQTPPQGSLMLWFAHHLPPRGA